LFETIHHFCFTFLFPEKLPSFAIRGRRLWNSGLQNKNKQPGENQRKVQVKSARLEENGEPGSLGRMLHQSQLTRQTTEMLIVIGHPAIGKLRSGKRHSQA
jgi:hypothetical protein